MQVPSSEIQQKKQLTNQQLIILRKTLQKRVINPSLTVIYSLAKKQSGTGFFENERLLLFHSRQCSLRYYSRIPKGFPFTNESQIVEGKQKIMIKDTDKFKFEAILDKISTIKVQWVINGKKHEWVFIMSNSHLRSQWVDAVNQHIKQKIDDRIPLKQNYQNKSIQKYNKIDKLREHQQMINNEMTHNQNPMYESNASEININNSKQPIMHQSNDKNHAKQQPNAINYKDSRVNQSSYPYNQPSNYYNRKGTERPEIQKITTDWNDNNKNLENSKTDSKPKFIVNQNTANYQSKDKQKQSKKQQFFDPATEIQYLKQQKPTKFNLTNQLSNRKAPNDTYLHGNNNYEQEKPDLLLVKKQQSKGKQLQKINSFPKYQKSNENQANNSNKQDQNRLSSKHIKFEQPINQDLRKSGQKSLPYRKPQGQDSLERQEANRLNNLGQSGYESRDNEQLADRQFQNRIHSEAVKSFSKKSLSAYSRKWNQEWCEADGNTQVYIYEQFVNHSKQLTQKIVDELPFLRRDRVYTPIEQSNPFFVYKYDGIVLILHYQTKNKTQEYGLKVSPDAPLIFSEETRQELKIEFENYNLIVSVTGNRGFIRVPLCCYFQYKGLIALCKAQIPSNFYKADVSDFDQPFEALEQLIKVKFPKSQFTIHNHPSLKYAIINDLSMLIPKIPNGMTPSGFFSKEFLTNYQEILCDRQTIMDAHHSILKVNLNEFLTKFQTLDSYIVDSNDLKRELNEFGMSYCYLPELFHQSSCSHLKRLITSQIVAQICANILRSQMSHIYSIFPTSQFDQMNAQIMNNIILDAVHTFVNEIFSYSLKAENIWKVVVGQANKRFRIVVSKQDIIAGYLLSALVQKIGLQCQFKKSGFDKKAAFFVDQNTIPRELLLDFKVNTTQYDSSSICPTLRQIKVIIDQQPDIAGFQNIVHNLQLSQYDFPSHINELYDPLTLYLANFIPFDNYGKYEHLDLYRGILSEPHSYYSTKISLLAAKWLIKRKNIEVANHIFQDKCEENSFWLGQFNPAVSQFYDFFSLYYASVGNYDESVRLAKGSLVNCIKILNANSLPTADKHYQLGNILFKVGKKQQALKEYIKTKAILSSHQQTAIPEYGTILLKMSLLYLNFGKLKDCVVNGLEALKIFDNNGGSEQDQIQTFQILSRAYEITRKYNDMASISTLCAQKFNNTENPKIFEKMIKIVLFPKLSSLSSHDSKSLQNIIFRLQQIESTVNYLQAFSFLHRLARSDTIIMKKFLSLLENISRLYQDTVRKDLFRKHRSLSYQTKSQAEQMLVVTQAICVMIGYGFFLGSLKQPYYQ